MQERFLAIVNEGFATLTIGAIILVAFYWFIGG